MTRDILAERCVECGRYMRPLRTEASDYPGRVTYGGRGHCANCYKKLRNKERIEAGLPVVRKRGDRDKSKAAIRGRDGRRAAMAVWDRDLSVDDQRVLYLVLRRFQGDDQAQIAGMLGLTDGTEGE